MTNYTTYHKHEQNQQRINDIFLQTIASGIYDFTAAQDSVILSIADQCVICGGDGVLLARSMYASVDPKKVFSDDVLCFQSGGQQLKRQHMEEQNELAFVLTPNPANDYVQLDFLEEATFEGSVQITDTNGRDLINQKALIENFNTLVIETTNLPSGLYIVTLYDGKTKIHQEKLMILR